MTKVHMIILCVIDHDDLGAAEVRAVLEQQRYPNHCIRPRVVASETREVEWSDDHPLNRSGSIREVVSALFDEERR